MDMTTGPSPALLAAIGGAARLAAAVARPAAAAAGALWLAISASLGAAWMIALPLLCAAAAATVPLSRMASPSSLAAAAILSAAALAAFGPIPAAAALVAWGLCLDRSIMSCGRREALAAAAAGSAIAALAAAGMEPVLAAVAAAAMSVPSAREALRRAAPRLPARAAEALAASSGMLHAAAAAAAAEAIGASWIEAVGSGIGISIPILCAGLWAAGIRRLPARGPAGWEALETCRMARAAAAPTPEEASAIEREELGRIAPQAPAARRPARRV